MKKIPITIEPNNIEEFNPNPYTKIIITKFNTAKEKLEAMSMEDGYNRMKVGICSNPDASFYKQYGIAYYIFRLYENSFDVISPYPMEYCGENKKVLRNLILEEVINIVGEHNILIHELFERFSERKFENIKEGNENDIHLAELKAKRRSRLNCYCWWE